jgi:hypothetical protein
MKKDLRECMEEAVKHGLYGSVEEIYEVLFGTKDGPDEQTKTTIHKVLSEQIISAKYGALLKMSGVYSLRNHFGVNALVVVRGPVRLGAVVGPGGKTAEFRIQMRTRGWVQFISNDKVLPQHAPLSLLLYRLNRGVSKKNKLTVRQLRDATEAAVRTCLVPEDWIRTDFPAKLDGLPDEVRDLLGPTIYGEGDVPTAEKEVSRAVPVVDGKENSSVGGEAPGEL